MNSFLPPSLVHEKNKRKKRRQEVDNLQTRTPSPWVSEILERLFSGTDKKNGGGMPTLAKWMGNSA